MSYCDFIPPYKCFLRDDFWLFLFKTEINILFKTGFLFKFSNDGRNLNQSVWILYLREENLFLHLEFMLWYAHWYSVSKYI